MSRRIKLGQKGELLAAEFLQQKGHQILHTNYRCDHKEIDLISLDGDTLVFTEIKTRSSYDFGFPEEAVTHKKQALLKAAATTFCTEHPQYQYIRFDVLSLLVRNHEIVEMLHFQDAFY